MLRFASPIAQKISGGTLALGLALSLTMFPNSPVAAGRPAISGLFSFDPLANSAPCGANPADAPFILPSGFSQTVIVSEASDPDYLERGDMNQVNETKAQVGRFLYRTHEVTSNAGVSVTDMETGQTTVLARRADWERFDGLKWTPWHTLLAAEEVVTAALRDPDYPNAESGLVYEIDPQTGAAVARPALGSKSHEGIAIDPAGNIYGIDEFAAAGIYKFVPDRRGDLSSGQLFVLKVVDEAAEAGDRTGTAIWLPLDRDAVQVNARLAAQAVGATTYNRPEDVELFDNVVYVAITREDRVLAIDLKGPQPVVTEFVRASLNVPVEGAGVSGLRRPDNLAVDQAGNLYIAEDNAPGDIWVATPDRDRDGAADSVLLFASLSDCASEPTGIYFAPGDPKTLFVNVAHDQGSPEIDKAMAISRAEAQPAMR